VPIVPGPRCADGERTNASSVASVAWAVWLAVPIVVTALAALWAWWRGRPRRAPTVREAMQAHRDYLDALAVPARGTQRPAPAPHPDPAGLTTQSSQGSGR
jgi:hypothetical protein